jgi:hypothetical protein
MRITTHDLLGSTPRVAIRDDDRPAQINLYAVESFRHMRLGLLMCARGLMNWVNGSLIGSLLRVV